MTTYRIIRFYEDGDQEILEEGLTLEEAKAHCNNPETSSRTCSSEEGQNLTITRGRWFDGYCEE